MNPRNQCVLIHQHITHALPVSSSDELYEWAEQTLKFAHYRERCRAIGIEPVTKPIRGGTDGSRLTEMGLPTPNLFTGMQDIHGPLEWVSVQDMAVATDLMLKIIDKASFDPRA